jgi:hypothetical protein
MDLVSVGPETLAAWLARRAEPAYAVLDAARDTIVYATLVRGTFGHTCLFEGHQARLLCNVAPYLVPLPLDSPLLAKLAGEWWGRSMGILLTSRARADHLLARLRYLLEVQADDRAPSEQSLVFRFYDPRVLRAFLPIGLPRQIAAYFGGGDVGAYACEGEDPRTMHVFTERGEGALGAETVALEHGDGDALVRGN